MRFRVFAVLGSVAAGLMLSSAAASAFEIVPLGDVPDAVRRSADRAAPGAEWLIAGKATVGGNTYYKFLGKDTRRRTVLVQMYADGRVIDVRTTIPADGVPPVAAAALATARPGFRAEEIQEVEGYHPDGRHLIYYRYQGKDDAGAEIVMCVAADGRKVFQEGR